MLLKSFVNLICCLIYTNYFDKISRRFQFIIVFVLYTIFSFFLGPSELLDFPQGNNLMTHSMVCCSFILCGALDVIIDIPIIPEMIERM